MIEHSSKSTAYAYKWSSSDKMSLLQSLNPIKAVKTGGLISTLLRWVLPMGTMSTTGVGIAGSLAYQAAMHFKECAFNAK